MSEPVPLVVDLQSGLLRTDLACEGVWHTLAGGHWRALLACRTHRETLLLTAN